MSENAGNRLKTVELNSIFITNKYVIALIRTYPSVIRLENNVKTQIFNKTAVLCSSLKLL